MGYDPSKNVHAGHRERLRNSFSEHGADHFETHQLLELLLFYAIPYKDTNPLSHLLINRFGSLRGVFEASVDELASVPGMGHSGAIMLRLAYESAMSYLDAGNEDSPRFDYIRKIGQHLVKFYDGADEEFVTLMLLDNSNALISCKRVFTGNISSAALKPGSLIEAAILSHASSAIIAHNHPDGMPLPSSDDLDFTHELASAFSSAGVELADHIIIAGGDFCSVGASAPAALFASNSKEKWRRGDK